jgi:hypothetical protein
MKIHEQPYKSETNDRKITFRVRTPNDLLISFYPTSKRGTKSGLLLDLHSRTADQLGPETLSLNYYASTSFPLKGAGELRCNAISRHAA